eukprot:767444-Hanusia_phi.AAC.5
MRLVAEKRKTAAEQEEEAIQDVVCDQIRETSISSLACFSRSSSSSTSSIPVSSSSAGAGAGLQGPPAVQLGCVWLSRGTGGGATAEGCAEASRDAVCGADAQKHAGWGEAGPTITSVASDLHVRGERGGEEGGEGGRRGKGQGGSAERGGGLGEERSGE